MGPCERPVSSCAEPEVRITEIDFGVPLTDYGSEWDTQPLPAALASMPGGGTRVAARGADGTVHVATLDCHDALVGTPFELPASDLQDIHADDDGGVVLVTRPASGSGEHGCGPGPLCGGTSAQCYNSYLVRFDGAGVEQWATPVTNAMDGQDAYSNGGRFVWGHYQHHGRIAFDGENYASYFCIGITVDNDQCVDIHQGDRMQVVNAAGTAVAHPQAMEVGCSHSWTTRIVWDPRTSEFAMVCATDNPDPGTGSPCRIARPGPYRTVAPVECEGQFWGGDLVLADGGGYWTAYTQGGVISLVRFDDDGPNQTIGDAGSADHAKLVTYGAGKMLLAWESGDQMTAQIYDSATGDTIGDEFPIDVEDHDYHAFKAFPDGSVAYPARGTSATTLRIARVMPCE